MAIRRTRDGVFECPSKPTNIVDIIVDEILCGMSQDDDVSLAEPSSPADLGDGEIDDVIDEMCGTDDNAVLNRGMNATAAYLEKRIRDTGGMKNGSFVQSIRAAINMRLPVSRMIGTVEDHVQSFFTKMIHRDSLANDITSGYKITDRQLILFAVRSSYTDIRDTSTDPVCRELFGSRTQKDRADGAPIAPIRDSRVVWGSAEDNGGTWIDIADTAANQEDTACFNQMWERLEKTIRENKPNAADRYIGILHSKADGLTVGEIAEEEGVSVYRAASMLAEVRRVLRIDNLSEVLGTGKY